MSLQKTVKDLEIEFPQYIIRKEDFDIGEQIGKGGFGEVYQATYRRTGQECAFKELFAKKLENNHLKRYIYEIQTMASCKDPFIVPFIGFTAEPPYCIVTEYMPNGSLDKYIRNLNSILSNYHLTIIAMGIAHAMAKLHDLHIIHRDLKSSNILLDNQFYPRICDFGIARFEDPNGEMTKRIGTPNYMAPELILSGKYNSKVDVYSYAMILYEMSERIRPFKGLKVQEIFKHVINNNERPAFTTRTPEALKKLIKRCWASEPSRRPDFKQIYQAFRKGHVSYPHNNLRDISRFIRYVEYPNQNFTTISDIPKPPKISKFGSLDRLSIINIQSINKFLPRGSSSMNTVNSTIVDQIAMDFPENVEEEDVTEEEIAFDFSIIQNIGDLYEIKDFNDSFVDLARKVTSKNFNEFYPIVEQLLQQKQSFPDHQLFEIIINECIRIMQRRTKTLPLFIQQNFFVNILTNYDPEFELSQISDELSDCRPEVLRLFARHHRARGACRSGVILVAPESPCHQLTSFPSSSSLSCDIAISLYISHEPSSSL